MRAKDFGIVMEDTAITHLSFSREYTAAVEAKQVTFVNHYARVRRIRVSMFGPELVELIADPFSHVMTRIPPWMTRRYTSRPSVLLKWLACLSGFEGLVTWLDSFLFVRMARDDSNRSRLHFPT